MLEDFFNVILDLKNIQRKGWINKLDIKNAESVADHSYSMTLMCMVISELQGLNTSKIVKMSLLHDLAESSIGDFTPEEIKKDKKIELENNAMKTILKKLPNKLIDDYQDVWNEFLTCKSKESVFVHDMDKFEMAFQAVYYKKNGLSEEKIQPFIESAKNEIKNKDLQDMLSKLF